MSDKKMPVEGEDYYVRVVPFPKGVNNGAMTLLNDDGTYSVYLNANFPEKKEKAAAHELRHIAEDDFYSNKEIDEIEDLRWAHEV